MVGDQLTTPQRLARSPLPLGFLGPYGPTTTQDQREPKPAVEKFLTVIWSWALAFGQGLRPREWKGRVADGVVLPLPVPTPSPQPSSQAHWPKDLALGARCGEDPGTGSGSWGSGWVPRALVYHHAPRSFPPHAPWLPPCATRQDPAVPLLGSSRP